MSKDLRKGEAELEKLSDICEYLFALFKLCPLEYVNLSLELPAAFFHLKTLDSRVLLPVAIAITT